jgi:S-adenosylmethionine synthetase
MTATSLTSESVTEGHPDKVCDFIADSILDAYLARDAGSRVACEVMVKGPTVVLAGEITSRGTVDHEDIVRTAVRRIGYTDPEEPFSADGLVVTELLSAQSPEIGEAVGKEGEVEQGAGDQGIMFGYATDETPELMPLPILLAHRLASGLASDRHAGTEGWLRPDGKTQVTVAYEAGRPIRVSDVVVSTQHAPGRSQADIAAYVRDELGPRVLGDWWDDGIRFHVNPSGSFELGGPSADSGLSGRKIIVDTYGTAARHGGGSFSGKDPSKVDRSGAYFCRWAARQLVIAECASRAEVYVAYAIGRAEPIAVEVETFGTGDPTEARELLETFDFRPARIVEHLGLLRPIYCQTTNYGHFGRPGLPWED